MTNKTADSPPEDAETRLRAMWTAKGIPEAQQEAIIADVEHKASPAYLANSFPPRQQEPEFEMTAKGQFVMF